MFLLQIAIALDGLNAVSNAPSHNCLFFHPKLSNIMVFVIPNACDTAIQQYTVYSLLVRSFSDAADKLEMKMSVLPQLKSCEGIYFVTNYYVLLERMKIMFNSVTTYNFHNTNRSRAKHKHQVTRVEL